MSGKKFYRCGIFDFEGTLVSFEWDIPGAVKETREKLESYIDNNRLTGVENYAELYNLISIEFPEYLFHVDEVYDRYDESALHRWKPNICSDKVLRTLNNGGVKLSVVSNVGASALRSALEKFDFLKYLTCVVSRNDVRLIKPDDEGLKKAIECMGCSEDETLFIGDSIADVKAGSRAGIDVAVVQGENRIEDLERAGAVIILKDLCEAVSYFKKG